MPLVGEQMQLIRHPAIQTTRPFAFDIAGDVLYEGCRDLIYTHDLRTGVCATIEDEAFQGKSACSVFVVEDRLVLLHQTSDHYTSFDLGSGQAAVHHFDNPDAIVWYGYRHPSCLLLFDRHVDGGILRVETVGAKPSACLRPWRSGAPAGASPIGDGRIFCSGNASEPCLIIDVERFEVIDQFPLPGPDVTLSGAMCWNGILYAAYSSGGCLMRYDLANRRWLEPLSTPEYGQSYGFIGAASQIGSTGYFCLSTYRYSSKIDPETGALIIPKDADIGVDGHPHHFLDRALVFDAETETFSFLDVPPQPDGIPLICYSCAHDDDLIFTGYVIPFEADGGPSKMPGDWLVWQSRPPDGQA